jgi:Zn-dependent alcohol dehydrogenase
MRLNTQFDVTGNKWPIHFLSKCMYSVLSTTFFSLMEHQIVISGDTKGAVSFHFKVPMICDLWENGKIYDIDSCRDYICGLEH